MDELKQLEELAAAAKPLREDRGALWMGIVLVLATLTLPAYQAVLWLQTGIWYPLPISSAIQYVGWHVPSTEWVGSQKILDWLFDLPMFIVPAFLAFGCFSTWKESLGNR